MKSKNYNFIVRIIMNQANSQIGVEGAVHKWSYASGGSTLSFVNYFVNFVWQFSNLAPIFRFLWFNDFPQIFIYVVLDSASWKLSKAPSTRVKRIWKVEIFLLPVRTKGNHFDMRYWHGNHTLPILRDVGRAEVSKISKKAYL